MSDLSYDVLVTDGPEWAGASRLPDGGPLVWNPGSSVLISGAADAVLVDPPFTRSQIAEVGDWIERSGRTLTHVYATHGHGDHWFGGPSLVQRFPTATMVATPGTIAMMHREATTGRQQLWDQIFPGLIPETPVVAEVVGPEGLELEGHRLLPIEVGHTDTDDTTILHVPDLGLVVAGDSVYNGVHQYLLEGPGGGFERWLEALDVIEALGARAVVAGHKNRDLPDRPEAIGETRAYLRDVMELLEDRVTPEAFLNAMTTRHPDHLNESPVWFGGLTLLSRGA
ncbi:MBL fold metallo-hydrolase [Curtobacterium sp. VKM Ac-2922]|uniref:MBL fold metallo-hydrolase n=1 Tax=Curtobacterium sp. VKM Ac-2922 TaxID=2929475 RepID=UPI001FB38B10|nr:MBL fold metallo-hydrolase [Curtobacterium sp. VKM Ac-2922]MCJ1715845.1 MBL fold metallo-hydrolase [Curtobacterium sp. VKM Ac-2922]